MMRGARQRGGKMASRCCVLLPPASCLLRAEQAGPVSCVLRCWHLARLSHSPAPGVLHDWGHDYAMPHAPCRAAPCCALPNAMPCCALPQSCSTTGATTMLCPMPHAMPCPMLCPAMPSQPHAVPCPMLCPAVPCPMLCPAPCYALCPALPHRVAFGSPKSPDCFAVALKISPSRAGGAEAARTAARARPHPFPSRS
jgi:hypothetical protein